MIIKRKTMLKSELARKLNISSSTLSRFMISREDNIKNIYPEYKNISKILYPKVIDYIIAEMGYSPDEIYY